MRREKAVKDWINTSLALSSNNEKTGEPEVTTDPLECHTHNNSEAVEDHNTSGHSIPKNCRGNYILSDETLQQLDPYYTPPENFLDAPNTGVVPGAPRGANGSNRPIRHGASEHN